MKKKFVPSIKLKINTWYAALMALLSLLLVITLLFTQRSIAAATVRQSLADKVDKNASEVYYEDGTMRLGVDFTFNVDGMNILVLTPDGRILNGEYPESAGENSASKFPLPGNEETVFEQELNETDFFVYDKKVSFNTLDFAVDAQTGEILDWNATFRGSNMEPFDPKNVDLSGVNVSYEEAYDNVLGFASLEKEYCTLINVSLADLYTVKIIQLEIFCTDVLFDDVYVRGVMSEKDTDDELSKYLIFSAAALPFFIVLAVFIGTRITSKALRSVDELSDTVSGIGSLEDIKSVPEVTTNDRELQALTAAFNKMIVRINQSFEAEKHFTADASHELKTPLAVILAQCDSLLERDDLTPEAYEQVLSIHRQSVRMNRLIGEMLAFARLEQGREHFDFETEDLSVIVQSVCDDVALISDKSFHLRVQDGVMMKMDVSLMSRLVENLVTNAVKYGRENGNVWVRLSEENKVITLSVIDDGIGIAEEDREKVFSRFYRVDKARSRSQGGSGLGLSMVSEICHMHGGRIILRSKPGVGSEFRLVFKGE